MADVKWVKIATDVFEDEKILLIETLPKADNLILIWFKLLCLAGKLNNGGAIMMNNQIPYTDKMLAATFHRQINTVKNALKAFEDFGMIEVVNGVITIPNWEKHQNLDQLEKMKESTKSRMAKYRERQKNSLNRDGDVTSQLRNSNTKITAQLQGSDSDVTGIEKDIDIDKDTTTDVVVQKAVTGNVTNTQKLEAKGGTLGRGILMLTEEQDEDLLDRLSLDEYNSYCEKLVNFLIDHPGAKIKSHYRTILKWVEEDRRVGK